MRTAPCGSLVVTVTVAVPSLSDVGSSANRSTDASYAGQVVRVPVAAAKETVWVGTGAAPAADGVASQAAGSSRATPSAVSVGERGRVTRHTLVVKPPFAGRKRPDVPRAVEDKTNGPAPQGRPVREWCSAYGAAGLPMTASSVRSVNEHPSNAPVGQAVAKFGVWLPSIVNRM